MRWKFVPLLATVSIDDGIGIDGESQVGVNGDTKQSGVSLKRKYGNNQNL